MIRKNGIGVSSGYVIAKAFVLDSEKYRIPRRSVHPTETDYEWEKVKQACVVALEELVELEASVAVLAKDEIRDIFAVHRRYLTDKKLQDQIFQYIQSHSVTAEYAVSVTMREIADHFNKSQDPYISERSADIYDIQRRLLRVLLGKKREDIDHLTEEVVVIAKELTPSQTAGFNKKYIRGIATDGGGPTGHTAIIARSLGIPAVVALKALTENIAGGDTVILDGNHGIVIINPDPDTIIKYKKLEQAFVQLEQKFELHKDEPAITLDGIEITFLGNIEFPEEANYILEHGGKGIGLYRTEFLYFNNDAYPAESDHFEAYSRIIRIFGDYPVTIRTMDMGGDKFVENAPSVNEANPFLGLRSIRMCLQNPDIFKIQLRAILRAAVSGNVQIMFPLITTANELAQTITILEEAKKELSIASVPYKDDIRVGIMVETPSAALIASTLAKHVDFFSIGTNDLIQYTLAVDRGNRLVSSLYSSAEPAVLKLIKYVIDAARTSKIDLSICGEMASEPEFAILLIGLGARTLSIAPSLIPELKKIVRSVSMNECEIIAGNIMVMESPEEIVACLRTKLRVCVTELL